MDDFRAGLNGAGEVDGRLLGVPVGGNTFALVHDPEAFERVGVTPAADWTWDEFGTAVHRIRAAEGDQYGASDNGGVMCLYDRPGRASRSSPSPRSAATFPPSSSPGTTSSSATPPRGLLTAVPFRTQRG
ncbi:hypothetical protein [Actinacidiphila glaucinigra]|uniref:hypothetical protein n=1 Tax=Actinacidiphila glaucinigra TaxID=235986 RepID=UPI0038166C7C